jgi:hypothetical protein
MSAAVNQHTTTEEAVFSVGAPRGYITRISHGFEYLYRSPASRRRRRKGNPSAWGYNRATLLLGDINIRAWPSRLGEFRVWDSKIWSWVPLARASSNCKRQTHPLVREDVTWGIQPQVCSWKKKRFVIVGVKGLGAKRNWLDTII